MSSEPTEWVTKVLFSSVNNTESTMYRIREAISMITTRSLCGDESGLRAGGRVPLASLGKVLVEPVTAIIIRGPHQMKKVSPI